VRVRAVVRSRLLVAAFAVLACAASHGADQSISFGHLTAQQGLSQNTVMATLQDSRGFMWFATENGLNRYDGYTMVRYYRDRLAPNGLDSDFVWSLAEDRDGNIWCATMAGLAKWDRSTNRFRSFRHDPENADSIASDSLRTVMVASDGRIWVGTTSDGLDVLDVGSGRFTHFHTGPAATSLSNDSIYVLHEDRAGHVWVGTDNGLNRFNPETGEFAHYLVSKSAAPEVRPVQIRTLLQDHNGLLWIGTQTGLIRFDAATESTKHYSNDARNPKSLSSDQVRALLEDSQHRLWIGTTNGLNYLDQASDTFYRYRHDDTADGLTDSYVLSLCQDAGGLIWVGTRAGGVNTWNPRSWAFGHVRPDWLKDTNVTSFAGDGRDLWVGTSDRGLHRIQGDVHRQYDAPQLSDEHVMALLLDRDGALWIGTMEGGLDRLDPTTDRVDVFRHSAIDSNSIGADGVMTLFEDRAGSIWIGTYGGGVSQYDPQQRRFRRYEHDPNDPTSLSSPIATAVAQDLNGNMWVGTDAGLNLLDPSSGTFRHFVNDPSDSRSLSENSIYALHVDATGTLWIGTAGGALDQLVGSSRDPAQVRFENISQRDGLQSNVVYGVRSDASGAVWLSTSNGLARLDRLSRTVRTYHRAHGIQGEDFNFGAHHRSADGELFFGGAGAYNAFLPDDLQAAPVPPRIALTRVEVGNRAIALAPHDGVAGEIDLAHASGTLMFEFAALDYSASADNRYAYRLEGLEANWTDAGTSRRATYTNLDAGRYTFRLKAANSYGTWNEQGLTVLVTVAPAPWKTLWAYAAYALISAICIGLIIRAHRARMAREAAHREQLRQLAYYDSVTGIPNRHQFLERLGVAIAAAEQTATSVAVIYIDLDQFKRINDTLGHGAGDAFLKLIAQRVQLVLNEASARSESEGHAVAFELARLGGDEFVALMTGLHEDAQAQRVAESIRDALSAPLRFQQHEFVITPSIGVSIYPRDGNEVVTLMKNADMAMYEAKAAGRNQHRMYTPSLGARAVERLALETDLRRALESDELHVVYQPKIELASGRIAGAEALLRWTHPQRGEISPAVFIPLAEESGLILDVDRYVLAVVVAQLKRWRRARLPAVHVAVNLSGREFAGSDTIRTLSDHVEKSGIDPGQLELEITETVLMSNAAAARATLAALKGLGFRVSLDDFGTGYSSLGYLKRFSLDALKIDRSFIRDLENNAQDQAICKAIISMAHGLGLRAIAEGVETEGQLKFLRANDCDEGQGYWFHRPLLAADFEALLRRGVDGEVPNVKRATPLHAVQRRESSG
jgi:diguanylate cyclase (GGDEF)-like protein